MSEIITKINALDFAKTLNPRQLKKLERYAVTRALQNFQFTVTTAFEFTNPKRRDGGSWTAMGYHFPAQYDTAEYNRVCEYAVRGGHRTSGGNCDCFGAKYLQLCEFDTTLWDHPSRFAVCGFDSYFNDIRKFLWCVYKNIPLEESGVCNDIIAGIDRLVNQTGLIARENGNIIVDIPVIDLAVLEEGVKIINTAVDRLNAAMGDELREHAKGNKTPIPKHLKSVPDAFRYSIATNFIVMGVIREAYGRGLFLHDVDYCCPPVVLVYDKKSVIE